MKNNYDFIFVLIWPDISTKAIQSPHIIKRSFYFCFAFSDRSTQKVINSGATFIFFDKVYSFSR